MIIIPLAPQNPYSTWWTKCIKFLNFVVLFRKIRHRITFEVGEEKNWKKIGKKIGKINQNLNIVKKSIKIFYYSLKEWPKLSFPYSECKLIEVPFAYIVSIFYIV